MKARRFVNVVTADSYLLSRIKLKNNLFYPSAAEAQHHAAMAATSNKKETKTAAMMTEDVLRLPPSKLRLKPSSRPSFTRLNYMPFYGSGGGGEGNVLCADDSGNTALYDADADTLEMMPGLTGPKGCRRPISFSVARGAGTLYILDRVFHSRSPTPSRFEALVYDNPNPNPSPYAGKEDHAWHWRPLPPPPVHRDSFVGCHALLHGKDGGGGTIYVSYCTGRDHVGTYRFDTGTGEWTKAGDWRLPFFSQGVHVPELGEDLLFGIELHDPYRFCAMDIASGLKMNGASVLRHAWLDIDEPPPEWLSGVNSVAYLGDGRFCIHRRFDIMAKYGMESVSVDTVVLLTGVEVVRAGSRLRMIKHKSKRLDCDIESVL